MKRVQTNAKAETLGEVYKLSVHVGAIVNTLANDCRNKAKIVRDLIPAAIFQAGPDLTEGAMQLLVDRWTYFEPLISLK